MTTANATTAVLCEPTTLYLFFGRSAKHTCLACHRTCVPSSRAPWNGRADSHRPEGRVRQRPRLSPRVRSPPWWRSSPHNTSSCSQTTYSPCKNPEGPKGTRIRALIKTTGYEANMSIYKSQLYFLHFQQTTGHWKFKNFMLFIIASKTGNT